MAWTYWCASSSTATNYTTNAMSIDTNNIWMQWSGNGTSATTAPNTAWYYWTYESNDVTVAPVQSEEERQEAQRQAAEWQRQHIEEQERKQQEKKAAEEKALRLLKESLTIKQLEAFEKDECIPVDTAKGNKYLIKKGRSANIHVIDQEGKTAHRLCVHPQDDCPDYDTMLAQKFFLEHCEDETLVLANKHPA